MTIKSVTSILLQLPYEIGGPKSQFLGRTRTHMPMLLVRVETSGGVVGWGDAFSLGAPIVTQCAIDNVVAPYVVGKNEDDFQPLIDDLRRKLHLVGRGGPFTFAVSGLDIALWDIAGKKAGRPLSELLGGARRTSLPAYATFLPYRTAELLDSSCRRAASVGYKAVKLHETKVEQAVVARRALGDDAALMLDVNCAWSLEETLGYLPQLEALNLKWLEEPVWPPETTRHLRIIKSRSAIPLATGESVSSSFDIAEMAESGAVDIVQPSVTKIGGVTEMMTIVGELKDNRCRLVPHCPYFGPGFLATLHIASTFPQEVLIEKCFCDLEASPLGKLIDVSNGRIGVPTAPGIGGEPDPLVIRDYQIRPS